ncbi:uncharacterized protein PITG_05396 [Phytophthora infestans T30-4]|uniref:Uncharacterized protein n=1 Tax=Phytophthora infestans (strain T30-4) TaxID=403677 RepID=D0N2Q3_PHYIT|nr:uncharacterized protein PITG_05396 [Phytophthora infestans T30-4]EEY69195.1 hypothetical protein PITG_05396 [Phytophthora infestans T30-4]|eukprot:XP_002999049.1 hypothetical protein PITG_05396 [Phytophthora infestans T30-4]
MSESKQEFLRSRPTVDVTAVDISPNPAALTDELNLEVDFHLDAPVINGFWDIEVVSGGLCHQAAHYQYPFHIFLSLTAV